MFNNSYVSLPKGNQLKFAYVSFPLVFSLQHWEKGSPSGPWPVNEETSVFVRKKWELSPIHGNCLAGPLGKVMGNFCGFFAHHVVFDEPSKSSKFQAVGNDSSHRVFLFLHCFCSGWNHQTKSPNIGVNENWGQFLTNIAACLDARLILQ